MGRKRSKRGKGNYTVGWGRPPVHSRWQPGQSGNPKGRPRGRKNLATVFNEALGQRLEIQEKGGLRTITVREAIVRRVVNEALKGNLKATAFVLAKEPEIIKVTERAETITSNMSAEQAAATYMRLIRGDK